MALTTATAAALDHPPTERTALDKLAEFDRLWRGFMTARATLGGVLLFSHVGLYVMRDTRNPWLMGICAAYFAAALAVRVLSSAKRLRKRFDFYWLRTVGIDLLAFSALQVIHGSTVTSVNYTPLFALPVLMAAVLGPLRTAMATAASVTILLFAYAGWLCWQGPQPVTSLLLQTALAGTGSFVVSFIASEMASQLAIVERSAERSQLAAAAQRRVNELVIEALTEGVIVVDVQHFVRSANPAAYVLLGIPEPQRRVPIDLAQRPGWSALRKLVVASFQGHCAGGEDLDIDHAGQGVRRLRVRSQITAPLDPGSRGLCVVFMQDQREIQARLRTEKLASMGRMSAAVAHEIRNPLAAIVQANALLAEDLHQGMHRRLTQMIEQNAQRLERIVHDILHLAQTPAGEEGSCTQTVELYTAIDRIGNDWQTQHGLGQRLRVSLGTPGAFVGFDPEHLRRILVNLLDNAKRYASEREGAIQVDVLTTPGTGDKGDDGVGNKTCNEVSKGIDDRLTVRVWSDSGPLDPSVEQHLFEPFFSSESRSSGLGLFICRELCTRHGATIAYERTTRVVHDAAIQGNEFRICLCTRNRSATQHKLDPAAPPATPACS
ncbi:sensor histidine kinase [Candidatus Symbiobacter mobilis]|uniref:histidine kinase n=1 Tax=Candidatus Symbiobacter mobilis CR TaxID=946483 RepID=U5NAR0_9BURK|nr:ATP-binding protein [Candidatus Symbiobacter mobilis]AGX88375.1 signal transduction histidine kinase PilS [Candidatus Symbiobacter mobilis CR]